MNAHARVRHRYSAALFKAELEASLAEASALGLGDGTPGRTAGAAAVSAARESLAKVTAGLEALREAVEGAVVTEAGLVAALTFASSFGFGDPGKGGEQAVAHANHVLGRCRDIAGKAAEAVEVMDDEEMAALIAEAAAIRCANAAPTSIRIKLGSNNMPPGPPLCLRASYLLCETPRSHASGTAAPKWRP